MDSIEDVSQKSQTELIRAEPYPPGKLRLKRRLECNHASKGEQFERANDGICHAPRPRRQRGNLVKKSQLTEVIR